MNALLKLYVDFRNKKDNDYRSELKSERVVTNRGNSYHNQGKKRENSNSLIEVASPRIKDTNPRITGDYGTLKLSDRRAILDKTG
jgi:hypothetical protein